MSGDANLSLASRITSALNVFSGALDDGSLMCRAKRPDSVNPLSKSDFLRRVSTYRIQTWFGKDLSPFVCSRYGWVNEGVDVLKCRWCTSTLTCGKNFLTSFHNNRLSGDEKSPPILNLDDLRNFHGVACPWRSCASPIHFSRLPSPRVVRGALVVDGRLLARNLVNLSAGLFSEMEGQWEKNLSGFKGRFSTAISLTAALQRVLCSSSDTAAPVLEADRASAILIMCGWRWDVTEGAPGVLSSAPPPAPKTNSLTCCLCGSSGKAPLGDLKEEGVKVTQLGSREESSGTCYPGKRVREEGEGEGNSAHRSPRIPAPSSSSSLSRATRAALEAAAAAVEAFSEASLVLVGGGGGGVEKEEEAVGGGEAASSTFTITSKSLEPYSPGSPNFHPLRSHAWHCPFLRDTRISTSLLERNTVSPYKRSEDLQSAARAISRAVVGLGEGELLGRALVEMEEKAGTAKGKNEQPRQDSWAHDTLLAHLTREEKEEEVEEAEEGEAEGVLVQGWVAILLRVGCL